MRITLLLRCVLLACLLPTASAQAPGLQSLSFEEEFALSTDRRKLVEKLIPGSPDYFYYATLERQHAGDLGAAATLLQEWLDRHGDTAEHQRLSNRQALLGKDTGWKWLQEKLNLNFNAQRSTPGASPDLPTKLDPALLSDEAWRERTLQAQSQAGIQGAALERYIESLTADNERIPALQRLDSSTHPRAPEWAVLLWRFQSQGNFGRYGLQQNLTLAQLQACSDLEPRLLQDPAFVEAWVRRLAPGADEDLQGNPAAREAHLERLEQFTRGLSGAFNSLKAHVLHHRLQHDLDMGTPDLARFQAYLRLPRSCPWIHPRLLESGIQRGILVNPDAEQPTGLPRIGSDEALVRALAEHFLEDAEDTGALDELLDPNWLRRVFAEIKILRGKGDMQRWYTLLDDAAYYEQLKNRVELRFGAGMAGRAPLQEQLRISLEVKNVPELIVRVYRLNALNWYTAQLREPDPTMELDGLIANSERRESIAENPLRRVRRDVELPECAQPGVYIVEFIGNGKASRTVVRRGSLVMSARTGAAGNVLRVFDEQGNWRKDAAVHYEGRRFAANERGEVLIPFSATAGPRKIVLEAGGRVTLDTLRQIQEEYRLSVAAFADREGLRAGDMARLIIRTDLELAGNSASLQLLEDRVLSVQSEDLDGISSTLEIRDPALSDTGEFVQEIRIPARLKRLQVTLRGKVLLASNGQKQDCTANSHPILISSIRETAAVSCPLLGASAQGWYIDVLGRNGEPLADQALVLRLDHAEYATPLSVTLKTDSSGRVWLGALPGITRVESSGFHDGNRAWSLPELRAHLPRELQGTESDTLRLAWTPRGGVLTRTAAELIEKRAGAAVRDCSSKLRWESGVLEIRGLEAGDYELFLRDLFVRIPVRVTAGRSADGWAIGAARAFERSRMDPLAIRKLELSGEDLVLQLNGASSATRVHLFATRFLPALDSYGALNNVPTRELARFTVRMRELARIDFDEPAWDWLTERTLSDEFRYILERRNARRFPGNLLPLPGLLVNRWVLSDSDTRMLGSGSEGSRFGGRSSGGKKFGRGGGAATAGFRAGDARGFAELDFLKGPRPLLANLRPDSSGLIRIPRAQLGDGTHIHALALDSTACAWADLKLAASPLERTDLRLAKALDSTQHLREQREVEFVRQGATLEVDTTATDALQSYDSLDDVWNYFRTRGNNSELDRFAFLLRWPELKPEEQRELYSQHACHELHLFLHEKDPEFFRAVVRPLLANKLEPDFLDRWLLEQDLGRWLEPAHFAELNALEKALLVRRQAARAEDIRRNLRESAEAAGPVDPLELDRAFDTALAGKALAGEDKAGFAVRPGAPSAAPTEAGPASGLPAGPGQPTGGGGGGEHRELRDRAESLGLDARAPQAEEKQDISAERDAGEPEQNQAGAESLKRKAEESERLADAGDLAFKDNDLKDRSKAQQLYQPLTRTQVYAESRWWRLPRSQETPQRVPLNAFWLDFALAPGDAPFVSKNFLAATSSLSEMLLAIAVLDLPFKAPEHAITREGSRMQLRAAGPLLAVRRQRVAGPLSPESRGLLVSQDYFRLDDPYRYEGQQRLDKLVTGAMQSGVAYGCRIVLTNTTSAPREVDVLLQIPAGSMPLMARRETRGERVRLEPWATRAIELPFYFPAPGRFAHYPVQVSEGEQRIAAATARTLEVTAEPAAVANDSWEAISQNSTDAEVLAHLEKSNLIRIDLSRIAWRMRGAEFHRAMQALLQRRMVNSSELASFAIYHKDAAGTRRWTAHDNRLPGLLGPAFESELVRIDPLERELREELEFDPLVLPRVHPFGAQRELLNAAFAGQYQQLLTILAHRPDLDSVDWLRVTHSMVLMGRTEEAIEAFDRVEPGRLPSRVQYDYLAAYLDFHSAEPKLAREIAERYRDYPIPHWRARFEEVRLQLDEAQGKPRPGETQRGKGPQAESVPTLALEWQGEQGLIRHSNIESLDLSYYGIAIEFLFSTHPFVAQDAGMAAYVEPAMRETLALAPGDRERILELPAALRGQNLLIEVRAGGLVRRVPCLQSRLKADALENIGQLSVRAKSGDKPIAGAYVKVYARRADGSVQFHKDGYTDLRGRFDYVSVSGVPAGNQRYALLVLSETDGAAVLEVAPPAQ